MNQGHLEGLWSHLISVWMFTLLVLCQRCGTKPDVWGTYHLFYVHLFSVRDVVLTGHLGDLLPILCTCSLSEIWYLTRRLGDIS